MEDDLRIHEKYGSRDEMVEKNLVEKTKDAFSFVDPLFELWLKREYGIV